MAFISKTELLVYIREEVLNEITQGDDTVLDSPIADAESLIREYLGNRYDIAAVFADGTNTNYKTLRKVCVDIALYYIYNGLVNPKHVPEFRVMNYEHACDLLKKYARGEIGDALPENSEEEGNAREKAVSAYKPFIDTNY